MKKCSKRNSVGPQLHIGPSTRRVTRRVDRVQAQAAHFDRRIKRLRRTAAQHGTNAREQFLVEERLGQIISACVQPDHLSVSSARAVSMMTGNSLVRASARQRRAREAT